MSCLTISDGSDAAYVLQAGAEQKVLIVPGYLTSAQHLQILQQQRQQQQEQQPPQQEQQEQPQELELPPCPFLRVSFASVDADAMLEGFARLRKAILISRPASDSA